MILLYLLWKNKEIKAGLVQTLIWDYILVTIKIGRDTLLQNVLLLSYLTC